MLLISHINSFTSFPSTLAMLGCSESADIYIYSKSRSAGVRLKILFLESHPTIHQYLESNPKPFYLLSATHYIVNQVIQITLDFLLLVCILHWFLVCMYILLFLLFWLVPRVTFREVTSAVLFSSTHPIVICINSLKMWLWQCVFLCTTLS